ncbi:MAG: metallophosphoesterase family protein [Myxococcales bacterium]|nr:metallophosphoesterase family protein [Myxococcales bacterium]
MPAKIGFISDVHGDVHALRDALRLLDEMGVTRIVCLGDVVDYGVFVDESAALLAERGIKTLRGNHDRWCLTNKSVGTNAADLTPAGRRFFKAMVPSWSATIEGVRVAAHHARPGNDMHGVMPDATADELHEVLRAAGTDVVVVGHTHRAMELRLGDRLVLNPGALLRDPADGWERELPTPGTFGVLELPDKRWTVFRARTGGAVEIVRAAK